MKTRISIIGTVGVPANYGGFETLAEHIIEDLTGDYDITVYCSGKRYKKEDRKETYKGAKLKYIPLNANGVQSIIYDSWSILKALFNSDVLLVLGVAGAWILPFVKLFTNKKIIISIDGIEWKRDKWSNLAKAYLFWAEKIAVRFSHIDISDNEAIQDYTKERYGTLSRIIEYGGDHTLTVQPDEAAFHKYPFLKNNYAFKVCRIEPENNVHMVLEAFEKIDKMPIVFVGNWSNSEYGIELKSKYKNHPNIIILDPIYNQEQLDILRSNATVYIHGHSAGGTNPSLVEAMNLGLPVVSFGISYNKVTTEYKADYFQTKEELVDIISNFHINAFIKNGKLMKEVADRRYQWKLITKKYMFLVEEALVAKEKISVKPTVSGLNYRELVSIGYAHLKNQ